MRRSYMCGDVWMLPFLPEKPGHATDAPSRGRIAKALTHLDSFLSPERLQVLFPPIYKAFILRRLGSESHGSARTSMLKLRRPQLPVKRFRRPKPTLTITTTSAKKHNL
jgi:hypothetical protein